MKRYLPSDEGPHSAGPQEHWRESVVLVWWDAARSIGGFHRIGHEPNHAGGFGAGDSTCRFDYDGDCLWTIEDTGISASLHLKDFHPSIDCYPKSGSFSEEIAPQHMEVAYRVVGSVTAGGKTYDVDGLGMRDHGWGPRHWRALLSHRWLVGVFSEHESLCALSFQGVDEFRSRRTLRNGVPSRHDEHGFAVQDDLGRSCRDGRFRILLECPAWHSSSANAGWRPE